MKLKLFVSLPFLILISIFSVKAQTGWVIQKLDEKLSVKFPLAPTLKTAPQGTTYMATDKDSVICLVTVIDFMQLAQMDSAKIAGMKDNPRFADGMKDGMAKTLKNYELGDVKMNKWRGYTTYNIIGTSSVKKRKVYFNIIVIGSKAYSLSCIVPDGISTQTKDIYLSTPELSH